MAVNKCKVQDNGMTDLVNIDGIHFNGSMPMGEMKWNEVRQNRACVADRI